MSKQSSYSTVKNALGKAILTTLILVSMSETRAQSSATTASSPTTTTVSYLGTQDDMFLFAVQYFNTNKNKFTVEIKESTGNILFKEIYNDKVFNKNFKIPKDLEGKLSFVIKNTRDNTVEVFEVKSNVRVSEDVIISKI